VISRIFEIIDHCEPDTILLENVQGLMTNQNGNTMASILIELTKRGYSVSWALINASWLGVLQNRPRLFILANKKTSFVVERDLFGGNSFRIDSESLNLVFDLLTRSSATSLPTARLSAVEEATRPAIGKRKPARMPFATFGLAYADYFVTAPLEQLGKIVRRPALSTLGSVVCPNFWKSDDIKSARYWGHSGETIVYLRDDGLSHCIGSSIGGSPLFGIEEKYVRTRDDEQALLEYANWNRSEKGVRIFRLRPERAMLLFGKEMTTVCQAFSESKISQTKKYQLLGNTVAPSVATHCGEAALRAGGLVRVAAA
jgi:site-specific DNA-cytosine methylase